MAVSAQYNAEKFPFKFPFKFARSHFAGTLSADLRKLEEHDTKEPHAEFAAGLNAILIWIRARTVTLPSWEYFKNYGSEEGSEKRGILELLNKLNIMSQQFPRRAGMIEKVAIMERPQIWRCGRRVKQTFIARRNCPRVQLTTVGDREIGLELDMYPPNIKYFETLEGASQMGFSIYEAGSNASMFAEVCSMEVLSLSEVKKFGNVCKERVSRWNRAMKKLGLIYRFYGIMNWSVVEAHLDTNKVELTRRWFGNEFVGTRDRANKKRDR
jgi:hypothetical protein